MKPVKKIKRGQGGPLGLRSIPKRTLPRSSSRVTGPLPLWKRYLPFRGRKFVFSWKKVLITLAVLIGLFVLTAASLFAYYVRDLPNPKKIANRQISQSSQILDRNGTPLYSVHGTENRTIVPGDKIADHLKQATIAAEDKTFYSNHGFDLRGITRALAVRLGLLKRDLSGGGSTITQQYIKLTLVGDDQSLSRKIKELILAIEIDQTYTKDEILTGYLNQISYGGSADGIEVAAKTYFGKSAKALTLSESATLAAIPNQPTYYSPYGNHLEDLFIRKDYILDRMVAEGYIKKEEAAKAKKEAPSPEAPNFKQETNLKAPHFVFYVKQKLIDQLDPDPQIAEQKLKEGGYKVTTSLDLPTQEMAQGIVSEMGPEVVKSHNATNAALVAVDPKTGEILSMVGSIDYNNSKSGNTNFANANLQPGSSFKPLVYATAWGPNNTYAPSSITYDVTTDFGNYTPHNYDGKSRGAITDRQALAGSLNIPAVKNLALAGIKESINTAKSLGITTLNRDTSDYGLSLVLGSGEVKPVEMAGAYAGFANGGMHNELRPILKIEKGSEVVQDFTKNTATKAIEPEVAYEINSVLSDNGARTYIFGAKSKLTLADRPVAAKSGTTDNNRDGWTIGYTPSISVAVWVGNNDPNKTMNKGADGSVVAAPIWNRFMSTYLKGKPVEQFSVPSTMKTLTVDKLSGKLVTDQSPENERVTDTFAPWQVPKESDNIHIKVKVVKGTNLLATSLTPADMVEEKIYFKIHSEQPDNSNWENPVQAWAKATYGDRVGDPPSESDTTYTEGNRPSINITSPSNGATVGGTFTISASAGGNRTVNKVEYFIDNVSIATTTSSPWSTTYNGSSLSSGSHILQAVATNDLGLSQTSQVTFSISSDNSPPGNVTGASALPGKNGTIPIKLSWTNPSDSDLSMVAIYQSSNASQLGTKIKTVSAVPGGSTSTEITASTGQYYFTLHPIDSSDNENQSTNRVSGQVLP